MFRGKFRSLRHDHSFEAPYGSSLPRDGMQVEAPFRCPGRLAEPFVLKQPGHAPSERSNACIKWVAERVTESDEWKKHLEP
jgi:hypothetical protein